MVSMNLCTSVFSSELLCETKQYIMNINIINNLKNIIIVILSIFIIILFILSKRSCTNNSDTLVIHDTAIVTRYEKEIRQDTVIRWFEKLKYVRNKPEEIHYQKVDSNIIEGFKENDLIFKIDKKKDELIINESEFSAFSSIVFMKKCVMESIYKKN